MGKVCACEGSTCMVGVVTTAEESCDSHVNAIIKCTSKQQFDEGEFAKATYGYGREDIIILWWLKILKYDEFR